MSAYQVIVKPRVELQIVDATQWYDEQSIIVGDRFRAAMEAEVMLLKQAPYIGTIVYDDVRRRVVRNFPFCQYYRVENNMVIIFNCKHQRQLQ